ncbi:MAG: patatin-like phospholipase family protein [Catalinimonas sp.]
MKVGLALSGGGARGFAHLGVLQALVEKGVGVSMISGTSAGAMAGVFYAAGLAPPDILRIFTETSFIRSLRLATNLRGILRVGILERILLDHMPVRTFEALNFPVIVSATNLTLGRTVYFSEGDLIRPVLASSCIPGLFAPVDMNGQAMIDGGLLNNMPVEPLIGHTDHIIGVHTNAYPVDPQITSLRSTIERSFQLALSTNVMERMRLCHQVIEPSALSRFTVFDMKRAADIYEIGYDYAMATSFESITKRLAS